MSENVGKVLQLMGPRGKPGAAAVQQFVHGTLIADNWDGDEAPYTQTIDISGVTADATGNVGISDTATDDQYLAAANGQIRKYEQGDGTMSFKAYGTRPEVDIPVIAGILVTENDLVDGNEVSY